MRIMALDNKNSKPAKTAAEGKAYPVLKEGKWICSDGQYYTDAYFARMHEKQIKKQQL